MDTTSEAARIPEKAKKTKDAQKGFEFTGAIEDLKTGEIGGNVKRLFEFSSLLSKDNRTKLGEHLQRYEACSPEFATKFLADRRLQNRVKKIAQSLAESDERLLSLGEAEICCDLMEPGKEDISQIIEAMSPKKQFKGLVELKGPQVAGKRLADLWEQLKYITDPEQGREATEYIQAAFKKLGLGPPNDPATLEALLSDPKKIDLLKRDKYLQDIYAALLDDRSMDSMDRSVEFYWRKDESGEKLPVMYVERYAVNPKTESVSKLGFEITLETEVRPDGTKRKKRIMQNVMIVIDEQARGSNEGSQFLLSLMPIINKFGIEEGEFVANLKIGSYNWTKIADMDVPSMVKTLSNEDLKDLGKDAEDEKKAKAFIMQHKILPTFEKNMAIAIGIFLHSIKNPGERQKMEQKLVKELMEKEYGKIKEKALAGEAAMEDLANLGKDLRVFRFDEDGHVVAPDNPKAKIEGHLGKAAIMGIPWKARVPLTREARFGMIEKLQRGSPIKALMQKMGILFNIG